MKTIGVDVGGTHVRARRFSHNYILGNTASEKISDPTSKKQVMFHLFNTLHKVIDNDIEAIGVGVPAIVDSEGVVYEAVNIPAWDRIPLRDILESAYGIPTKVDNDANCFALAEKIAGKGKLYDNIIGLILGTGVGAGVIIDGKIYHGHNTGAGEFGEVLYKDGKFEDYCSSQFFHKKHGVRGEVLLDRAVKGETKALELFDKFGYHLGKLLATIVNTLDPEAIIIGGGASQNYEFFKNSMMESLEDSVYHKSFSRLNVEVSELEDPGVLGAAHLFYSTK